MMPAEVAMPAKRADFGGERKQGTRTRASARQVGVQWEQKGAVRCKRSASIALPQ